MNALRTLGPIAFALALGGTVAVAEDGKPLPAAQGRELFFHNDLNATRNADNSLMESERKGCRLYATADGGVTVKWTNQGKDAAETLFQDYKYIEGLESVSFRLTTTAPTTSTVEVGFQNRYSDDYRATVTLPAVGQSAEITLPLAAFKHVSRYYSFADKTAPGDEILTFYVRLAGGAGVSTAVTIHDFTIHADGKAYRLFDTSGTMSQPFTASKLHPNIPPKKFVDERKPRVFIADAASWQTFSDVQKSTIALAKEWGEENFGVDIACYHPHPGLRDVVKKYNDLGIKTTTEIHKAYPYFSPYLINNGWQMTRSDGFTMRDPAKWNSPDLFPWPCHGEDVTRPETVAVASRFLEEELSYGLYEVMLIDNIWPWNGRWGFGQSEIAAFVRDLQGKDEGVWLANDAGKYEKNSFWNYLALFTDVPYTPADLGLSSWDAYRPVGDAAASAGGLVEKKKHFLFVALYHYEHLKFTQKMGDSVASKGGMFVAGSNPDDVANGCDMWTFAKARGVEKFGYEFFSNANATRAWHHNMRWFSGNLRSLDKDMTLIAEINFGAHGRSHHSPEESYAFYYDITSCAKPIDYNNQYVEWPWNEAGPDNEYHFKRYGEWAGGALAFLRSHAERAELQPQKDVVLVATRGILEFQDGFSDGMTQSGSLARHLEKLHYPYDSCGKDGFAQFAKPAKVLVYSAPRSSPGHLKTVENWLSTGKDKTLVTHSTIPFDLFDGGTNFRTGINVAAWEFNKSYTRYLDEKTGIKTKIGFGQLNATGLSENQKLSALVDGKSYEATLNVVPVKGGTTLLAATDGTPLVQELKVGGNRIIHITPDISKSDEGLGLALADFAMRAAKVSPVASAPANEAVHPYEVAGGKSCVVWNVDVVAEQQPKNDYFRKLYENPVTITFPVEPNTSYVTYDFFANHQAVIQVKADGKLAWNHSGSCDIFYFGKAGGGIEATIAAAQKDRARLASHSLSSLRPVEPFEKLKASAKPESRFLVFSGSMVPENKGKTDGVILTFSTRDTADAKFALLARHTLTASDFEPLQAISLDGLRLEGLQMTVGCNTSPSYDATLLRNFAIVDAKGAVLVDLTKQIGSGDVTKGLSIGRQLETSETKFADSGATCSVSSDLVVLHPGWNNGLGYPCAVQFHEIDAARKTEPFSKLLASATPQSRFLVFAGSMQPENRGKTDGVNLTFSIRETADAKFTLLARHAITASEYEPLQGIALEGVNASELQMVVDCNTNPAYDATTLRSFAIVDANGKVLVDLAKQIQTGKVIKGLSINREPDTSATKFTTSGAGCSAKDGIVSLHPGWDGGLAYPCFVRIPVEKR